MSARAADMVVSPPALRGLQLGQLLAPVGGGPRAAGVGAGTADRAPVGSPAGAAAAVRCGASAAASWA